MPKFYQSIFVPVFLFYSIIVVNAQVYNEPAILELSNLQPYNYYESYRDIYNFQSLVDRRIVYDGWLVDVDLEKIRNKPVINEFLKKGLALVSNNLPIKFSEIPSEILSIHLYGNGKKGKTSVVLRGSFDKAFIDKYVINFIQNNFKLYTLNRGKVRSFKKGKIFSNLLERVDENGRKIKKRIYIGTLRDDFIVISQSLRIVRAWFYSSEESWSFSRLNANNENAFAQFLLNVQPTLNQLRHNEAAEEKLYKSVLLKHTQNIYITLSELNDAAVIGALFTALNKEKAKRISQIFDGIIALSSEKNTDEEYKSLYNNFVNILDDKTVRLGTKVSLKELKIINDNLGQ